MSKRFLMLAVLGAFALVCVLQSAPVQANFEPIPDSLVGCLNPGAEEGTFVLTNPEDGEVMVIGDGTSDEDLATHAHNHQVELTGIWVKDDEGNQQFEASKVEHQGICE